ncbi:hypothetical protein [Winogradskyella sp. PC D3.3]
MVLITACGSTKNTTDSIADEKFELCSEIKYNKLVNQMIPIEGKMIYQQNIHSLLENFLIQEKYLTEISKNGYLELLDKVKRNEIKSEFFERFNAEIGFEPDLLFPINSFISCYGYLFERLNIIDADSWQYDFGLAYNKYEAYGNMEINNTYLKEALNKIPNEKFRKLTYRKLFLDLIYVNLN